MNLDNYDDVDTRIHAFYAANPNGRITTRLEHYYTDDHGALVSCVVSAAIYRADGTDVAATGLAQEHRTERGVNAAWALENAETSAIGRALANLGYSTKGSRPSREEMQKVAEVKAAPKTSGGSTPPRGRRTAEEEGSSPGGVPVSPSSSASPTMGEAIGAVLEAMPGSTIVEQGVTPRPAGKPASEKQIGAIRGIMKSVGITDPAVAGALILEVVNRKVGRAEELTSKEASAVIDRLKAIEAEHSNIGAAEASEDPWHAEEVPW
jgi:hypothetical protein